MCCIVASCTTQRIQLTSLAKQPALFSTMDITTDGFGFMLSLAVAIEPFVYSLQARYLVFNPIELGPFYTAAIVGVNLLGFYLFRAANAEKNDFRNGKNPKSAWRRLTFVDGTR